MAKKHHSGGAKSVHVPGHSYKRNGKTVHVKGYNRKK